MCINIFYIQKTNWCTNNDQVIWVNLPPFSYYFLRSFEQTFNSHGGNWQKN